MEIIFSTDATWDERDRLLLPAWVDKRRIDCFIAFEFLMRLGDGPSGPSEQRALELLQNHRKEVEKRLQLMIGHTQGAGPIMLS